MVVIQNGSSAEAVSGDQNGSLRLWRLASGHCVHRLSFHSAPIAAVTLSKTHIISCGLDDILCICDKVKGHLLHSLRMVCLFFLNLCLVIA